MARKDEILHTFLSHPLLKEKYNIHDKQLPKSVAEGIQSEVPIIKSISLIVSHLEVANPVNDNSLRSIVTTYLNSAIA